VGIEPVPQGLPMVDVRRCALRQGSTGLIEGLSIYALWVRTVQTLKGRINIKLRYVSGEHAFSLESLNITTLGKPQMIKKITCLVMLLLAVTSQSLYAVGVGASLPDCNLTSVGNKQNLTLNQYRGKVLYVDFWASWCGPCAKSFPFMNELHQQLKDQGLQIVAVNLDENADDAKAFLAKYPASFTVMADASKQCAKDFDVKAMPSSYLIDRNGVVQHVHLGFRPGEAQELQVLVEKLLAGKASGL
jgi:thiol-disulfide isomerase/thioredoxin